MSNSMGPYRALSSGVSGLTASLTPGTRILPLTSTREFIRAITSAIASWLQHRVHFIRATTLQHRVHFIRATTLQQSSVCQSNHTTTQSSLHQSNHYNTEFTSSEQSLQHRVHFVRATTLQHRVHFIRAVTTTQSSLHQSNHVSHSFMATTESSVHQSNHTTTESSDPQSIMSDVATKESSVRQSNHTTTESSDPQSNHVGHSFMATTVTVHACRTLQNKMRASLVGWLLYSCYPSSKMCVCVFVWCTY